MKYLNFLWIAFEERKYNWLSTQFTNESATNQSFSAKNVYEYRFCLFNYKLSGTAPEFFSLYFMWRSQLEANPSDQNHCTYWLSDTHRIIRLDLRPNWTPGIWVFSQLEERKKRIRPVRHKVRVHPSVFVLCRPTIVWI